MTLNADIGESYGTWKLGCDEDIIVFLDMASVACGFHGGDASTMRRTVKLAKKHNVIIGAHPSYPDLLGFGRRKMSCTTQEIEDYIIYQYGALQAMAKCEEINVEYIKLHGALYNDLADDDEIFKTVIKVCAKLNTKLMVLAGENKMHDELARIYNVSLIKEVFADRAYTDDGKLVKRNTSGAVLTDSLEVAARIKLLKQSGKILSQSGKTLALQPDTICVHGDNREALNIIKTIKVS